MCSLQAFPFFHVNTLQYWSGALVLHCHLSPPGEAGRLRGSPSHTFDCASTAVHQGLGMNWPGLQTSRTRGKYPLLAPFCHGACL